MTFPHWEISPSLDLKVPVIQANVILATPECPNCVSIEDSIDPFLPEDPETYQLMAAVTFNPYSPQGST